MKTFGTLSLVEDGQWWEFSVQPHVRMKLKQVFGRVDKNAFAEVRIRVTPESCRDVEWFCERYPMVMDAATRGAMRHGSLVYRDRLAELEVLMAPSHAPRSYSLALPLREYQARAVEVHAVNAGLLVADELGVSGSVHARMALSATPIYNYGGEIFNIIEVVAPGRLGDRHEFYREWCQFYGNQNWIIKDPAAFGLHLRDEFLMLRRTRSDVGLELPQVERPIVTIPHQPEVLKRIEGNALELARLVLSGSFEESGEAARDFDLKLRQATGVAKAASVADFVRMIVENGEKVLLFGWHREVYDIWLEKLKDLHPVLYTGTESAVAKAKAAGDFRCGYSKVMIMSLRSGVGLDGLQEVCHTCVFGELDWSPGVHEQCVGRLNRDGVGRGVMAYFLVSEAGSDPVMAGILGLKTAQHKGVVDLADGEEPEQADPLAKQNTGGRIKALATDFLTRRGEAVPERSPSPKASAEQAATQSTL